MRTLVSLLALALATPAAAQTIAVIHADAWTLEADTPIRDATIVIDNGRITSVAPLTRPGVTGLPRASITLASCGTPPPGVTETILPFSMTMVASSIGAPDTVRARFTLMAMGRGAADS